MPDRWQRWIAVGNLMSVLLLAVGLYFTYQANQETSRANRETSAANREQQRLIEQGQVTDRFSKAVEQLGQSGKIDVRLGAIYSLERIMRDSTDDQPAIVEVLTAFVRIHAPAPDPDAKGKPESTDKDEKRISPLADIQAALTVLGRRDASHDRDPLDLHGADLRGADLTDANLISADLSGAYLYGANLFDAYLSGANLISADLFSANLTDADLTDANLNCAETDGDTRMPGGVARPAEC